MEKKNGAKNKLLGTLPVVITGLAVIGFYVFLPKFFVARSAANNLANQKPHVSLTTKNLPKVFVPHPKPAVPVGAQTYQISEKAGLWPKILQATIDPPDVHVGFTQKLSIIIKTKDDIASVEARIETDRGVKVLPLLPVALAKGEVLSQKYAVGADGIVLAVSDSAPRSALAYAEGEKTLKYAGEWTVKDTHDKYYHTTFVVKTVSGAENSVTLAWSDACAIPNNGSWTLSTSCTLSAVDGVDNGNATITTGGTLTLNNGTTFAYNSGKSISVTGTGKIVVAASGASISKTNLWMIDADADHWYASTTEYAQDTAPTNGQRRNTITGTAVDCNDSNAAVWQNLTVYRDLDGDGYGAGTSSQSCSGNSPPAGWTQDNTDCYDSNANANPGSNYWGTVNRGDGSFDYNCDGIQTLQYAANEANSAVCNLPFSVHSGFSYQQNIASWCPNGAVIPCVPQVCGMSKLWINTNAWSSGGAISCDSNNPPTPNLYIAGQVIQACN